jgi:photosystem II stability/assembly factor-like uncharacterized protein
MRYPAVLCFIAISCASSQTPPLTGGLEWRLIGPHRGGRSITAAGIPNTSTYFFGSVGGGIWKTVNAGETWTPIFDQQHIASIGSLAIASSNPDILYAGTGEADIRSDVTFGDGVYKSTDGGKTWMNVGLRDTRHIGRVLIHPANPDIVFVAALGHAYGPNDERGVFRSKDGGASWQKILFKDANTGAIDLTFESGDPDTIYAALWQAKRPPWSTYPPIEGPGSGLYKSTDGGETWHELTGNGLPSGQVGRIGIAVAPSDPHRVYALIEAKEGGLFRSDDSGATWTRAGTDARIRGRAWYFSGVTVDPGNADIVYCPNVALYRSIDAGKSFTAIKGAPGGDDYHFLWIDPQNSTHMALASDQGTVISVDGGNTWSSWYNQPTGQFYHVSTDNQFPYLVYGAQQDSGTAAIASRTNYGSITFRDWEPIGAGESGAIQPDPLDPNIVYGGSTYGSLFRFDRRTGQSKDISPSARVSFGKEINQRQLRFTWTSPLAFSPHNPKVIYFGSQYVLRSADQGMSWQAISPDLTGTAKVSSDGPLSVDNAKARGYGVVYSMAPSPLKAGQIWAGTDTGLVQLTRDEGKTWSNVTPPGLADWSKIGIIDASYHDAGTAYIAIDRHRLDDYEPYVYRTHDFGKTWTKITTGLAAPAFVNAVREDPIRKGLLYAGTELGVYVSFDDGDRWQSLQLNLPVAPVRDLAIHGNDLVIATHGRSFWILDDVTPLREPSDQVLFKPAKAIRMRGNQNHDTPLPPETPAGLNPPEGAILYYNLPSTAQTEVSLEILDTRGQLIRRYSSTDPPRPKDDQMPLIEAWLRPPSPPSKDPGLHRFVWDLRYAPASTPFREYSMETAFGQDTPILPRGPLAVPGTYQVRLTVDGKAYTQPLIVTMDPRVKVSPTDLAKQLDLGLKIRDALQRTKDTNLLAELTYLSEIVDSADGAPTTQALKAYHELVP